MTTKDITVNQEVFHCPIEWTVKEATEEIRSRFGLQNGGIDHNNVPVLGSVSISSLTGSLAFVGGSQAVPTKGATAAQFTAQAAPPPIESFYEPSTSPSSVKSEDIKAHQLDDAYYTPCANSFTLIAHLLAYESLPPGGSDRLRYQIEMTLMDLQASMSGSDPLGYCSQNRLHKEGVSALLTANISKCFAEYCRCMQLENTFTDQVSIMHQSGVKLASRKAEVDISLFYRFLHTDMVMSRGYRTLFPLLFMEFTKTTSKSIDQTLPQAATYANFLFRLMDIEKLLTWVPLLGVVMSENEMLFRLYSPSVVDNQWKIAEVDVLRCPVSHANMERLLHIMVGWTTKCVQFLRSPAATPNPPSLNTAVVLRRHCNVVALDNKIFKSYDYRRNSERSYVDRTHRRCPEQYLDSGLAGVERVVNWTSHSNPDDNLQIIAYDLVPGVHRPAVVGHLMQLITKTAQLHEKGIVHGDLRFSNIVFSEASSATVKSTIIDFDYSGPAEEKAYPPRFNPDINDGYRHAKARAFELLHLEHDVASLQWMCEQYRPTNVDLRAWWSSCVSELLVGSLREVAGRLGEHELEELEQVDKNVGSMLAEGTAVRKPNELTT